MNFMDFSAQVKAYFRQSEGQIWLVGIVVLGITILISLGYLLYDTFGSIDFSRLQSHESIVQQAQPEVASITQISQTPLFGPSHQTSVSRVNTNLQLLGVMLDSDPKKSKAIIASMNAEPKIVHVDEELADGGKLYRVYENKVELKRNGQIESLYLKWDKRDGATGLQKPMNAKYESSSISEPKLPQEETEQSVSTTAAEVDSQQPAPIQTPQDWQERIKEIREKYQQQFGTPNGQVPAGGMPNLPLGPKGRFRGNI